MLARIVAGDVMRRLVARTISQQFGRWNRQRAPNSAPCRPEPGANCRRPRFSRLGQCFRFDFQSVNVGGLPLIVSRNTVTFFFRLFLWQSHHITKDEGGAKRSAVLYSLGQHRTHSKSTFRVGSLIARRPLPVRCSSRSTQCSRCSS